MMLSMRGSGYEGKGKGEGEGDGKMMIENIVGV